MLIFYKYQAKTGLEAQKKYNSDKARDMLFNMKATKVPKGVWFSTVLMSIPLFTATGYLALLTPFASDPAFIDPNTYVYIARTCVRLLSLNLSFLGGVHYGLASA
jgi:hypothetical protein